MSNFRFFLGFLFLFPLFLQFPRCILGAGDLGETQVPSGPVKEQRSLIPAWEEYRDRLKRSGINFWASYTAENLGNPSGGRVAAFRYASGLEFGLIFDLESISNLKDLMFEVSADYRAGHDLSRDIGNVFVPAQIFGIERRFGGGAVHLYRLSLEQFLLDFPAADRSKAIAALEIAREALDANAHPA